MNRGDAHQLGVPDTTVAVRVVSVEVGVLVGVAAIVGMDAAHVLPAIGHPVVVRVCVQRTGEVLGAPRVGDLVLLDVVQAVLVRVAVGIRGIGWIEEATAIRIQCVAVLEAVGHAIAVGVPVPGPVQTAVTVHVLLEPRPVAMATHVLRVGGLQIQGPEHRHPAVHTQLNLAEGNLVAIGD